jgi:hypothetical protein
MLLTHTEKVLVCDACQAGIGDYGTHEFMHFELHLCWSCYEQGDPDMWVSMIMRRGLELSPERKAQWTQSLVSLATGKRG